VSRQSMTESVLTGRSLPAIVKESLGDVDGLDDTLLFAHETQWQGHRNTTCEGMIAVSICPLEKYAEEP